ncbi:MAG: hypothetical protein LBK96_01685 [Prevotellaceae bacterium]|jgi:hypothetical protein|nr:hypothetical protein [Prevotellaceae bacterium]
MKEKVSQIITALLELQGKGYFNISLECEGNSFSVRIYKGKLDLHKYPVIEYSKNATQSMLINGSGYYVDDQDNNMLYFVDYEIKKRNKNDTSNELQSKN